MLMVSCFEAWAFDRSAIAYCNEGLSSDIIPSKKHFFDLIATTLPVSSNLMLDISQGVGFQAMVPVPGDAR